MLIRTLLCTALLAVATVAGAQQPAARAQSSAAAKSARQQLTPEQREAIVKFRKAMLSNAESVLQLIDQDHAGQVWDNGSEVMKQSTSRDKFVAHVEQQRRNVGKLESRKPLRMYRTKYDGKDKNIPAGDYFNIQFVSRFANEKQPYVELVSYHYDSPTLLRVSGYAMKQVQPRKPAAKK